MPRYFNRVVNFSVRGEIYDTKDTTAESIIRNYNWTCHETDNNEIVITGKHKDHRGRITKMVKLPRIYKPKKPDTELFLNL